VPILNPDHLLQQADQLISPVGGGAPRQADLRRALSTAYYALFHAIVTQAADTFVGRTQRSTAAYSLIYRSVEHRNLKALCVDIKKPTLPSKYSEYAPAAGFGADLMQWLLLLWIYKRNVIRPTTIHVFGSVGLMQLSVFRLLGVLCCDFKVLIGLYGKVFWHC
jgi:hypothetical protein